MEKILKNKRLIAIVIAAVLLVAVIVCTSISCSRKSITGTYKLDVLYNYSGKLYYVGDVYGDEELTKEYCVVKIKSDNAVEITTSYDGRTTKVVGIWYMINEKAIYFNAPGMSGSAYFNEGKIIVTMGRETLILAK